MDQIINIRKLSKHHHVTLMMKDPTYDVVSDTASDDIENNMLIVKKLLIIEI